MADLPHTCFTTDAFFVLSQLPRAREDPELYDPDRRQRLARGAGRRAVRVPPRQDSQSRPHTATRFWHQTSDSYFSCATRSSRQPSPSRPLPRWTPARSGSSETSDPTATSLALQSPERSDIVTTCIYRARHLYSLLRDFLCSRHTPAIDFGPRWTESRHPSPIRRSLASRTRPMSVTAPAMPKAPRVTSGKARSDSSSRLVNWEGG